MRFPIRRSPARPLAAAVLLLLTGAAATACSTSAASPDNPPAADAAKAGDRAPIRVLAAENFWGSIAAQLGGSHAAVTSVISNPATDPHDYEPTAADARTAAGAQYAIVNGIGYDTWADKLLAASPADGRRELRVGDLVGVKPGGNPHRWYSPADVHQVIDRITADYTAIDPADAAYFAARRTAFETTALGPYDQEIAHIKAVYAGTPIGASESIVSPLAQGLGLRMLTPDTFLSAISEGTDPTARDKSTVDRQIATHAIRVYVYNSQNSTPDVREQVKAAKAAGIPVATVTETLAPAGASFQQWQTAELKGLAAALHQATGR
ncbi:metal ABC transporter solute-binding protein, Zn/Mn family [Actinacidiphila yeochonensis]|uniref:metal ABC transporter solute-binding protein, Zn/Mn family n=1 Tax=Actinacidiphila yeochonensis TaxID=89050 RepID=UPI00055B7EBF|nr:zinc ABC transporter substrate-binding protein [Actinacidiphila yeochonensis]